MLAERVHELNDVAALVPLDIVHYSVYKKEEDKIINI